MPDETDARFKQLCEQASQEQDPKRLHALIQQINKILDERTASRSKGNCASNS